MVGEDVRCKKCDKLCTAISKADEKIGSHVAVSNCCGADIEYMQQHKYQSMRYEGLVSIGMRDNNECSGLPKSGCLSEEENDDITYSNFKKALEKLINKYSIDNFCGTHDFILMEYVMGCIENYKRAKEHYELMKKR